MEDTSINKASPHIENTQSQSEKNTLLNKDKYISLQEDPDKTSDVTKDLLGLMGQLKLGQMVHTKDFKLYDTMSAVELNHFKMDPHYNNNETNTYRKLKRLGKIKTIGELTYEESLSLIDNLLIREMMWAYGSQVHQTVLSLVYFTDPEINKTSDQFDLIRIYLDSTLHMLYLCYKIVPDTTCMRDEDLSFVPFQNVHTLKREKSHEDLKKAEVNLKEKVKSAKDENRLVLNSLLMRIKFRREYLKMLEDLVNLKSPHRYESLNLSLNQLKDLFKEIKLNFNLDHLKLTEFYFDEKLSRIVPSVSNLRLVHMISYEEYFSKLEKFLTDLTLVSRIFDLKDFIQLLKSIEHLNNQNPSFIIRCILEINLFPNGSDNLFDKHNFQGLVVSDLNELKVNYIAEGSQTVKNIVMMNKELLVKSLRNKTRQVRESKALFDALAVLVIEGNQTEKLIKQPTKSKGRPETILTSILLKQVLTEMNQFIWSSFELELFTPFELDYVFSLANSIISGLYVHNNIIAGKFADKIIREYNFVNSSSKKKLSPSQKMILDEIYIFNAMKLVMQGMTIMCSYITKAKLILSNESEEQVMMRIRNRFPQLRNCNMFVDLSYENYCQETNFNFDHGKEETLSGADDCFKQAIKILKELRGADLKLRNDFLYSNEYIDNLCKSIVCNNMTLSKIRKADKPIKLNISLGKYNTFLPILEIV